jgi:threonine/homoserine/homoserine lactone efflux protein
MGVTVFLLKGIILGFSIAAPVGPIGVLCIRRTLNGGIRSGIISGLGTALADALYGLVAAFGLTAISSLLVEHSSLFRLCGGLALLYMGSATFLSHPADTPSTATKIAQASNFGSAFFLTLTNPLTILSFTAIFAGIGIGDAQSSYPLAAVMVGGVFFGSLLWWILLSGAVGCFRSRFNQRWLVAVNRISGITICIFGLISLATLWS